MESSTHARSGEDPIDPTPVQPSFEARGASLIAGAGGATLHVLDPDDGCVVSTYPVTDPALMPSVMQRAAVLRNEVQSRRDRARILSVVAGTLETDPGEMTAAIVREGVKTTAAARTEVLRAARTLRLSAAQVGGTSGATLPDGEGGRGIHVVRRPAGVIAAFTSYNDPLNLVAHKLGPAVAAGCPVVLSPDPRAPTPALMLLERLRDAGLVADHVQIVLGDSTIVEGLVSDPAVRVVSATCGRRMAEAITRRAGARRVLLELGGVCPAIVTSDADLGHAASAIAAGAFGISGQNCLHTQVVLIERNVYGTFVELLEEKSAAWLCGRKLAPDSACGPLIDEHARERVEGLVEDALAKGARIAARAPLSPVHDRLHVPGTLLSGVPRTARLWSEEVFGPVVVVEPVDDLDAALGDAARTDGLQASIFTQHLPDALAAAARLPHGSVIVNDCDLRDDAMPFGGTGPSGIGREGPAYAIREYLEEQAIVVSA